MSENDLIFKRLLKATIQVSGVRSTLWMAGGKPQTDVYSINK